MSRQVLPRVSRPRRRAFGETASAATRVAPAALAALCAAMPLLAPQRPAPAFPARLDAYLTGTVKLTSPQRASLLAGAPVTTLLEADEGKEVSVFGAVWIEAPVARYVAAVQDIEHFERGGGFTVTRRISTPPVPEDFADLHLRDDDVKDLRTCRVGDCVVKLDAETIRALRSEVDWNAPGVQEAVDRVMRRFALHYVTGYLEGGNERLAVYRDHSRPTFVADQFRAMVDQMPELTAHLPNLRRYLLEYPAPGVQPPPETTSFLYWQETEFGLRPTIRISHLTVWQSPDGTAVASKMLYASHYFWTGLELRLLVEDPARGPGFWFVTVSRSRSDGLSGFSGLFVRGRVRGEAQRATLAALRATKRVLEMPAEGAE